MRCAGTTVKVIVSVNEPTVAVIVVEPAAMVVAKPELLMVATVVEDEFQVAPLARSALECSVNCCRIPIALIDPATGF